MSLSAEKQITIKGGADLWDIDVDEQIEEDSVVGNTSTSSSTVGHRNQEKYTGKGPYDDIVFNLGRDEPELYKQHSIRVKDICNKETHEPEWNLLVRSFPLKGEEDPHGIKCTFDPAKDVIWLKDSIIVSNEASLRAAIQWFKNLGRLNVYGYLYAREEVKNIDWVRAIE